MSLRTLFAGSLLFATAVAAQDSHLERMAQEHAGDTPQAAAATELPGAEESRGKEVVYAQVDGVPQSGYLAGGGGSSAVLVIHEWWGLNDNIRAMADRLAAAGYTALAVDLYAGEVAETRDDARSLMGASRERQEALEENLRQAHQYLREQSGAETVGVIGWCFGGGWSLRTGLLLGDELDAVVIYYGRLETDPDALSTLAAPVLGIFGALDRGIPLETVGEFESALQQLGKEAQIHVYEGADHAFANPSGTRYQPDAAEDAWDKTLAFFERTLR